MIFDKIENKELYFLNKRFKKAFEFIETTDLESLKLGKIQIDADNLFAIVNEYSTQENEKQILEAHKKYIDLQFIIKGSEIIEFESLDKQKTYKKYNSEDDYSFYSAIDPIPLKLKAGDFAIFFPDDLHMPGIINIKSEMIKKIVFKIKI